MTTFTSRALLELGETAQLGKLRNHLRYYSGLRSPVTMSVTIVSRRGEEYDAHLTRLANGA